VIHLAALGLRQLCRQRPDKGQLPVGVSLSTDIEFREDRNLPYRARVRWVDPSIKDRKSKSESFVDNDGALAWIDQMQKAAAGGIDPNTATMTLVDYGKVNWDLAVRGLEKKTLDPYRAGWRKRVVPTLGHIPPTMISNGVVDRAVHGWIEDECSRSTIKNSIAILVRVMEQALRDGIITRNPARISGWQREFSKAEDELDNPRALALPDWHTLTRLAGMLVEKSADHFAGWGDVVIFAACTAARIGEVSGCRVGDIDTKTWNWTLRRQTTPGPGGLIDKGTKGKRARTVPLIEDVRELVERRIAETDGTKDARLFTGPRGGRITTAVLRDATHWDEVVTKLGYEHLTRHGLRPTGLTWLADAGVSVYHLQRIAGHGSITTTQRYIHPDMCGIEEAGDLLTKHLRSPRGPQLRVV
jgi:integrase